MSRYQTKAQVAFEFVILISILFGALLVFTSFVRDNFSDAEKDTAYYQLKDMALSVQSEFNLAASLEDGYRREFFLPLLIGNDDYNISTAGDEILFSMEETEYVVRVPEFSGDLAKGNNVITKEDGVIEVNP